MTCAETTQDLYGTMNDRSVLAAARSLIAEARTIRDVQFLKQMVHDARYSETQGRPVSVAVTFEGGRAVSVAVAKSQQRKRGVWGRYATLTYAFTSREFRRQGKSHSLCRLLLDATKADRVKSLAASRAGLALHRALGHKFWGCNEEGKVIADSPLFGQDREGVPPQVVQSGGLAPLPYPEILGLFEARNPFGYNFRDDPEEYLLNGAPPDLYGYRHTTAEELLNIRADSKSGEMLRWENRAGTYVKKPPLSLLEGLVCFADATLPYPWAFAGHRNGALVFRVTVSKIGERRHAG